MSCDRCLDCTLRMGCCSIRTMGRSASRRRCLRSHQFRVYSNRPPNRFWNVNIEHICKGDNWNQIRIDRRAEHSVRSWIDSSWIYLFWNIFTVYCLRSLQVRLAANSLRCWWACRYFRCPAKIPWPDRRSHFYSPTSRDWSFRAVHQSRHAVELPIVFVRNGNKTDEKKTPFTCEYKHCTRYGET